MTTIYETTDVIATYDDTTLTINVAVARAVSIVDSRQDQIDNPEVEVEVDDDVVALAVASTDFDAVVAAVKGN